MPSFGRRAVQQGRCELGQSPVADPAIRIGRDIGCNECAKGSLKTLAACKDAFVLASFRSVAGRTSASPKDRLAAGCIAFKRGKALRIHMNGARKPQNGPQDEKAENNQAEKQSFHRGRQAGPKGPAPFLVVGLAIGLVAVTAGLADGPDCASKRFFAVAGNLCKRGRCLGKFASYCSGG